MHWKSWMNCSRRMGSMTERDAFAALQAEHALHHNFCPCLNDSISAGITALGKAARCDRVDDHRGRNT